MLRIAPERQPTYGKRTVARMERSEIRDRTIRIDDSRIALRSIGATLPHPRHSGLALRIAPE